MSSVANANGLLPEKLKPPATEAAIMARWGSARQPVVSICCATFNHAEFIADAIDSFLAQETSFPFEIIVRDDASTDGTADILREYQQRYPSLIRTIVEPENRYKEGICPSHVWGSVAQGEFIALCEGDDFWISATKLQLQLELMRRHPSAVMAVGRTHFCRQGEDCLQYVKTCGPAIGELLGFEQVHRTYFHTSTYLIRADVFRYVLREVFFGSTLWGDTAWRAVMASLGDIALVPEALSVYRMTGSGIWTGLVREDQLYWEIQVARRLEERLPGVHGRYQRDKVRALSRSLLKSHVRQGRIWSGLCILPLALRGRARGIAGLLFDGLSREFSR